MARLLRLIFTSGILFALGCSRPGGNSTRIVIQAPNSFGKVGAMSAMPANRKVCYGINVTGPGINMAPPSMCNPPMGTVVGFVEANQEISATISSGAGRSLELYAYLMPVGSSGACPKVGKAFAAAQLLNTYSVAKVQNLNIVGQEMTVEMTAVYPGDANYLAASLSMPAMCTTANNNGGPSLPGFSVSSGMQEATGTGFKMKVRVGAPASRNTASGGGYKLIKK